MRKYLFVFLLISGAVILFSCKKNNNDSNDTNPVPAPTGNLLNSNTYLVDTLAISSVTSNSLVISKSNTSLRPKVGDILIAAPTSANPYGFLSKVKTVTENGNQIVCTTEPSNLNDAFKQLNIKHNYSDSFSSNAAFRSGSSLSITFQNNNTLINGLSLSGILKLNVPSTQIEFVKASGSLAPEKVVIRADLNTEGSTIEIANSSSSAITVVSEKTLEEFDLPPIVFTVPIVTPVGVIPVPMRFAQKIIWKWLPVEISGKAKLSAVPVIHATLGVKYENGNWSNLSTYSIDGNASQLLRSDFGTTLDLSANFTLFKPVYEISPYATQLLKGFFEVPFSFNLSTQTTQPNYSLNFNMDVTGGIKTFFWDGVERDYSISGNVISKTIWKGNWDATRPVLTTLNPNSITQTTTICGGDISSDGDAPVTNRGVCWSTTANPTIVNNKSNDGTGTGSFTSNISGLTANTTYHVRAYATNSVGTAYGNDVSFITTANLPTLTTVAAGNIAAASAISGGNITNDGGSPVTIRGVCWSSSTNPTIANSKTNDGPGTGNYVSNITGLIGNTTYYVRAYATNSVGTDYGNQISFTTQQNSQNQDSTFIDPRDGQMYTFRHIGTQVWMTKNLNHVSANSLCYNGSSANCDVYGRLYTWDESKVVAPPGWHLPSLSEWNILINFLGGTSEAGGKMKSLSQWVSPNTGATNSSGFNAIPGGFQQDQFGPSSFANMGYVANWWSSTIGFVANWPGYPNAAWITTPGLYYNSNEVEIPDVNLGQGTPAIPNNKLAIRCIRD